MFLLFSFPRSKRRKQGDFPFAGTASNVEKSKHLQSPRFLFLKLHFARYLTQHYVRQLTGRVFMLQQSREMDVVPSRPKSVRLPLRARFVPLRSGMRRSRVTSTGILQEIKRHLTFGFSRSNSAMPFRIILHLHTH